MRHLELRGFDRRLPVGSDDAEVVAQQLSKFPDQIVPENLTGLPKYIAYARILIDGMPSSPFSMHPLPPPTLTFDAERAEIIRRVARRRFAVVAAVKSSTSAPAGPHSPTWAHRHNDEQLHRDENIDNL